MCVLHNTYVVPIYGMGSCDQPPCVLHWASWLVVLWAASWQKCFESQRIPRKFFLAGRAQTGIVVCKLQPSDIYHHLIFRAFCYTANIGKKKKKPMSALWCRFVSAALFFSQCLPSLPGTSVWGSTLEKFRLLISCYRSGWAMVHKLAVIFHIDSTQILFV